MLSSRSFDLDTMWKTDFEAVHGMLGQGQTASFPRTLQTDPSPPPPHFLPGSLGPSPSVPPFLTPQLTFFRPFPALIRVSSASFFHRKQQALIAVTTQGSKLPKHVHQGRCVSTRESPVSAASQQRCSLGRGSDVSLSFLRGSIPSPEHSLRASI